MVVGINLNSEMKQGKDHVKVRVFAMEFSFFVLNSFEKRFKDALDFELELHRKQYVMQRKIENNRYITNAGIF